jgi:WD40 repeat protein
VAEAATPARLVEKLRDDQRRRWQQGDRVRAEAYLQEHPALEADAQCALELVYNEILLREEDGEEPGLEDYLRRFPRLAPQLRPLFEVHWALGSGALAGSDPDSTADDGPPHPPPAEPAGLPVVSGYTALQELGRGGMGVVYRAWQTGPNRPVALKMVLAGDCADAHHRARFRAEAEAVGRLHHPNIVSIYEVGDHGGRPYLAMEYVDGDSLAVRLRGTPLPVREAAALTEALAQAVHHAHQRGIVHRDLTPANVLLAADGTPKLTDFGLAKFLVGGPEAQTQTGAVLGTPSYMAPEQAAGRARDVGPAADVWALGAILYELLTGRPPFRAETPLETLLQARDDEPVPPRRLLAKVPRDLETVCLKCLQKDPPKRYASALALAEDLQRYLRREPVRARPAAAPERAWRWCRRNPVLAGLAALSAVLLAAVAVGGPLAAWRLSTQRDALRDQLTLTEKAEQEAQRARRLAERRAYEAQLAQARAIRYSGRAGRQFEGLTALTDAARLLPALGLEPQAEAAARLTLRNEAIACMTLADLRVDRNFPASPPQSGYPIGVAFDADVLRYAQVEPDGTVTVRSLVDNAELVRIAGLGSPVRRPVDWRVLLRFSPDGKLLATRSEPRYGVPLQVWDLGGPRRLLTVPASGQWYYGDFDFSPDSRVLATGRTDGSIALYDVRSAQLVKCISPGPPPKYVRFHPAGHRLAVCRGPQVEVLDLAGRVLLRLRPPALNHQPSTTVVAWSADGELLANGGTDGVAHVWMAGTGQHLARCTGHRLDVVHVAFSHGGDLLASASWDATTRLWDPCTGRQLVVADGFAEHFSRDDRWLGVELSGPRVGRWEVATGRECRPLYAPQAGGGIHALDIHPDGRLLAAAADGGLHLRDLATGKILCTAPLRRTQSASFDSSGHSLLTSGAAGVYRWPIRPDPSSRCQRLGPARALPLPPECRPGPCAQSRDGLRLVLPGSSTRDAIVTDLDGGHRACRILKHPGNLCCLAMSPNGRWVATGIMHGYVSKVWDARTGRLLKDIPSRNAQVLFSPDNRWLGVGTGQEYALHQVEEDAWPCGQRLYRDNGGDGPGPMAFSRDSRTVALAHSPWSIKLWDLDGQRELATLAAPVPELLSCLYFSADVGVLVCGTQVGTIHVWDLRRLRARLREMGLDWGPQLGPPPARRDAGPLRVEVDLGDLTPREK